MGKCKQTRRQKCMFTISICSSQCNYSMKRQQFHCLVSFAQNTDVHTSGKNGETPRQDGISAENQPLTGYEPIRIEVNRTLFNLSDHEIDDQEDVEEIGVKPVSCSQSLIHSHCNATRLGSGRQAITCDAGFTPVYRSFRAT